MALQNASSRFGTVIRSAFVAFQTELSCIPGIRCRKCGKIVLESNKRPE
jgi:hypothetical protein